MYQSLVAPGDNVTMLQRINEADYRLLEFGRWNWTRAKVTLSFYDENYVTLPPAYTSILGARLGSRPKLVHTEEFEFSPDGIGEVAVTGCTDTGLIDQGYQTANFGSGTETRRVYKIAGTIPDGDTVVALVRRAPVTLTADNQSTLCPDNAALKLMMFAINLENENDIERSRSYISDALRGLDNKEKAHRAGARQTFNTNPYGAGISGIPNIR